MKKITVNVLFLFCIVLNSYSQGYLDKIDPYSTGVLYRSTDLNNPVLAKTEGTQYLNKDFQLAEVSDVPKKLMVRYNAVTDTLEIQSEGDQFFSLTKKAPYNTITMVSNQNKLKLLNYTNKEGDVYGYLSELHGTSYFALYRRDKIILQKATEARTSYQQAKPAKFVKTNAEYYLSLENKTARPMPKNKKELQDLFPMKKEEIAVYLKKNTFSLKEEKSIIEIAKFLSAL
ncbi:MULTISPECIES: hypothetical protein [unclassified Flavobacterium]|uniref:hypothetical protein n=1 Tax=unclassified Flavobacterium TaxID=196869 RepID=UPI000F8727AA|nr:MULTISPECIES: hypothetical protein [unclassified Flavobacterium]RTY92908.1 hypothetical protein EKM01_02005 [Flavobacterium sp. RSP46]RTZ08410.1 hypothetical protein EKM03_02050 [Flavobacterium sp. GSP6]